MAGLAMFVVMFPVFLLAYGMVGIVAGYLGASVLWCLIVIPYRLVRSAPKAWRQQPKVPEWLGNWLFEAVFFSIPSLLISVVAYYLVAWLAGH